MRSFFDTNGGTFPSELGSIVGKIAGLFRVPSGFTHNDCGMAVANSVAAVENGARHVQGTYIGFGERCGNASLSTIIANLGVKRDYECLPPDQYRNIVHVARHVAAISNVALNEREPFIGNSAFAHKGGMHIDGVDKASHSFEHIQSRTGGRPASFPDERGVGRRMILDKIWEVDPTITKDDEVTDRIMSGSRRWNTRLSVRRRGKHVRTARPASNSASTVRSSNWSTSRSSVSNRRMASTAPRRSSRSRSKVLTRSLPPRVTARCALWTAPCARRLMLSIRNWPTCTLPITRCESLTAGVEQHGQSAGVTAIGDGDAVWTTVGVSTDIIEASWIALVDSIEYKLLKLEKPSRKA